MSSSLWDTLKKVSLNISEHAISGAYYPEGQLIFPHVEDLTLNFASQEPEESELEQLMRQFAGQPSDVKRLHLSWDFGAQDSVISNTLESYPIQDTVDLDKVVQKSAALGTRTNFYKVSHAILPTTGRYEGLSSTDVAITPVSCLETVSCLLPHFSALESLSLSSFNISYSAEPQSALAKIIQGIKILVDRGTLEELRLLDTRCIDLPNVDNGTYIFCFLTHLMSQKWFIDYGKIKHLTMGHRMIYSPELNLVPSYESGWFPKDVRPYMSKTSSKLESFTCYGMTGLLPVEVLLDAVTPMKSLKKLIFLEHTLVHDICQRVISCYGTRVTSKFETTADVQHAQQRASEMVLNLMAYTHRVDDYGQDITNPPHVEELQAEFVFLYGASAKLFFKALPKLEVFVLYGYPFRRDMLL